MSWIRIVRVSKEKEELLKHLDKKEIEITRKAAMADKVLDTLGVPSHTETGKQIRAAVAMELLGSEFEMIDKYSKGVFVKTVGKKGMMEIMALLNEMGLLTKSSSEKVKQLEHEEKPQEQKQQRG